MKIQSSKTNRKTNKISDMQGMISSSKQNPRASLLRERKKRGGGSFPNLLYKEKSKFRMVFWGGGLRQANDECSENQSTFRLLVGELTDASTQRMAIDVK